MGKFKTFKSILHAMEQIQLQKQNTKSPMVKRGRLAGTQLPVQNYGENLV